MQDPRLKVNKFGRANSGRASLRLVQCLVLALLSNAHSIGAQAFDFDPSTKEGFDLIQADRADQALEFFNKLAREKPDSADVHLGRASALRFLSRHEDAIKEYKLALQLSPSQSVAKKANDDIRAMERSAAGMRRSDNQPFHMSKGDVEKCMGDIMRQSEDRIKQIHSSAENYAGNIYKSSLAGHNRNLEGLRRLQDDYSFYDRWGRRQTSGGFFNLQRELTTRSQNSLKYARQDYDTRRREAEVRAVGLKDAAEGLQSQILQKPSENSGVYMVPSGTNLYVRNYAHFDPVVPEAPVALHAVPEKITGSENVGVQEDAKKASVENAKSGKHQEFKKTQ